MDAFLDTLKNMGGARLGAMALVMVGLLIFFVFVATRAGDPSMTLLYGDLSSVDSANVAAELEKSNIPYSISPDGANISVSRTQVGRARMLLAEQGLPNGGSLGYEIFDKAPAFGTTDFVQNINQLRALEGELARTIGTLAPIQMARVHLVLPERQLFSRDSRPASASVFIDLRANNTLDGSQVSAIQHLIASAVPQLKPANVSIVDENGTLLARGDGDEAEGAFSGRNSEEMRRSYEMRMTRAIEDMVSRIVGHGRVRANVTADLDFDRISTNSEIYDPEGQVVRSTQTVEETSEEPVAGADGTVSVTNNLPGLPAETGAGAAAASSNRLEEVTNFEISRTVENIVRETGEVKKLSVAVLVDGRYTTETNEETGEETRTYEPRSQEELDQIATLVKSAIGYDEDRGDQVEVINMQFADVQFGKNPLLEDLIFGFKKTDILQIAETATMGILGVLVLLLVVRPMISQLASVAGSAAQQAQLEPEMLAAHAASPALAPPGGGEEEGGSPQESEFDSMIDMSQVEGRVKASSVQKINELVENHPNETVSAIRSWMSQEG